MSTTVNPPSKLRIFATWSAIVLMALAAVWAAVILWWQITLRVVSTADAVIYLVVLPCVLLAVIGLIAWRNARGKRRIDAPPLQAGALPADFAPPKAPEPQKLAIINAWAAAGPAANAAEFIEILTERRLRPQRDPELTDDAGFPILSSRASHLDTARVKRFLADEIATGRLAIVHGHDCRDAVLRALALLEIVIGQFAQDCFALLDCALQAGASRNDKPATLRGNPLAPREAAPQCRLHVRLLLPAAFQPQERRLAQTYLSSLLSTFPAAAFAVELDTSDDDALALALADKFGADSAHEHEPHALLLLACDSALCPAVIEQWQNDSRLFNASRQNGLMAGEAAFGVFCANAAALALMSAEPACHMHRVSRMQREVSADAPGKPSHACLEQAVQQALELSGIAPATIGSVACDANHRTNRVLECIGAMMSCTAQLDAIENRLALGETYGHLGAASALGILAAGALQAAQAQHPALLFNVGHATERAAAVLTPAPVA